MASSPTWVRLSDNRNIAGSRRAGSLRRALLTQPLNIHEQPVAHSANHVPLRTVFLAICDVRDVAEHDVVEHHSVPRKSRSVIAPIWERG